MSKLTVARAEPAEHGDCPSCEEAHDNINHTYWLDIPGQPTARLCWSCAHSLARQVDETHEYTPRGEGKGSGWVRVGRYDSARRRALWVRFVEFEGPVQVDEYGPIDWPDTEYIEVCAGREGDDAYVCIDRSNPAFEDLDDCLSRAMSGAVQDE